MLKFMLLIALLVSFSAQSAFAAVGFREMILPDEQGSRPMHVSIWYPTDTDRVPVLLGETPAFRGQPVVKDAETQTGPHPLVLLSHGYGGSWRNLAWLARELVHKGYVVAAPDHPGTTTFDMRPPEAVVLWKRPRDLSRVIDALLSVRELTGGIASDRIAAIGHSLGGWTVIELAGGRFDAKGAMTNCMTQFGSVYCKIFKALGVGRDAASTLALGADLSDRRIGAVVTLDLGPGRGLTPQSLASVRVPALVVGAAEDVDKETAAKADIAATNKDSAYLAQYLPSATTSYAFVPGSLHFSFMQSCKPGAAALIEQEAPGESIVCKDGQGADRNAIHRQVADMIVAFLQRALPTR
ncbi:Predicted dienelactone hydrolase [Rhizobium mongolense subsp. loessense]|uniref:Predicted dienelactone hydrolase n=1 Tax=Rhizobium mongolense subsp. loessense TaxID=158890 RepID=A0A1G4R9J8_9HYPH|nr:alpha/beta fold hydrolase [Rhizobium mongolense]SCW53486.1 Predicted dienelactone hydrolase [Rhizobium mongolense subsp. loessense]